MNDDEDDVISENGIDRLSLRTKSLTQLLKIARRASLEEDPLRTPNPAYHQARAQKLLGSVGPYVRWSDFTMPQEKLKGMKKRVRAFYEHQNRMILRFSKVDRLLDGNLAFHLIKPYVAGEPDQRPRAPRFLHRIDEEEDDDENEDGDDGRSNVDPETQTLLRSHDGAKTIQAAIIVNFIANIVLLFAKLFVAYFSNSLAVLASLVDSVLDFLSSAIIWFTTHLISRKNWKIRYQYPVGRNRMEPLGVVIFSIIMIVSFAQVASESVQRLFSKDHKVVELSVATISTMVATVIVKGLCWAWCKTIKTSAIEALAQDAMTDVIFNSMSIFFPLLGFYMNLWWMDPVGALFLCAYIILSWWDTCLDHIKNLCGAAAKVEDRQVILYLCSRFAKSIRHITAVSAYHAGDRLNVEVDIMLADDTSPRDGHDVGEALQYAIELLPIVERAFVHLEYDYSLSGHHDY